MAGSVTARPCACGCGHPAQGRVYRGLRDACYTRERRADRLDRYPLAHRPSVDTAEDAVILRGRGMDLFAIAAKLGRAPSSVVKALERQRAAEPSPELERTYGALMHQLEARRWARRSA